MAITESKCPAKPDATIYTINGISYCAEKRGAQCALSPISHIQRCSYPTVRALGPDQRTAIQQAKAATNNPKVT